MSLEWVGQAPKQPEDGSYRVVTYRQRTRCERFSIDKARNSYTGQTVFTAWHHTTDPDAPAQFLGSYPLALEARERCERYRTLYLQPRPPLPSSPDDLGPLAP